jgi:hypothetical protein
VLVFEDHPQRVADGGFIVDNEDTGFHVTRNSKFKMQNANNTRHDAFAF